MLSILGSTGSIGRQTIDVAQALGIKVSAIAAGSNVQLIERQARLLKPELAVLYDEKAAAYLRISLADTAVKVASGMEGLIEATTHNKSKTVLAAMSGAIGLKPALAAIQSRKRLALANKETLVCAGEIVTAEVKRSGAELIPVDSEHSAIFQCLQSGSHDEIKRLIITASGGPFKGKSFEELETVTVSQAIKHPNWSMGSKITIDSATLMNKGLEFIEAMHLFGIGADNISVLVHPQSIIHSMVEYVDGSVIAQLGMPDMRLPIQLALTWPKRLPGPAPVLDFLKAPSLSFFEPDYKAFPCLSLAISAAKNGGADCAILNAANEVAVDAFLTERIGFNDISRTVEETLEHLTGLKANTLDEVIAADEAARRYSKQCIS
jgi:1-deoxy-D-xylulose-5-phosphate reductoisomerase